MADSQPMSRVVTPISNNPDPKQLAREMVLLMSTSIVDSLRRRGQSGRLGKQYGDKRDLYNVLGYLSVPSVEDYWQMYLRQDIAKRIVRAKPSATWRRPPMIQETESPDITTPFEKAFEDLQKRLRLWSYLHRADRLAGVGFYGVMLIGVNGNLESPVRPKTLKTGRDILYLSTFSQRHAKVKDYVDDPKNPRYGKPLSYEINLAGDLASNESRSRPQRRSATSKDDVVDASRVIHLAEDLTEDEVHGTPRLEPVINRMFDIEKVVGGGAEMYWRSAYGGFALEVAQDAASAFASTGQIDPNIIDEFAHGMRRWIDVEGYKLHEIQGRDVKPGEMTEAILQLVSSVTEIPIRILLGSERGELSSAQDERNWNAVIEDRQQEYATPLVRDFVDRMIAWGVLPEPTQYEVVWPSNNVKTDKERAEEFESYAKGIAQVAPPGAPELVMTPTEVRTRFLDLPPTPEAEPGGIE